MTIPLHQFTWPRADTGATGVVVLAWDGRIDNRSELRWRLAGALGDDTSDAAIARALFERHGVAGLRDLVGDWSVVFYDAGRSRLVLASDFMGIRPLYFCVQPQRVLWSARLDTLADAAGVDAIDDEFIGSYLLFGRARNRTPYVGIHSVPPGQAVSLTPASTTREAFWTPPTGDTVRYANECRYDEQLRALFQEAVSARVRDHAQVVAELSGGLDSSSVVCMASRLIESGHVDARLTTVSYVHRGSHDLPYIRAVETHCGIEGIHFSTHDDPLVSAREVGTGMPEGWGPIHRSVVATAHRLGAPVILTGQGGDLLMGNWFDDSLQVSAPLRSGRIVSAWRDALAWSRVCRTPIASVLGNAFRAALPPSLAPRQLFAADPAFAAGADTSLTPAFASRLGLADRSAFFSRDWLAAPPERRRHFLTLTIMRELRLLQRYEPGVGLDYAHPFTHRPLVEFLMCIPADVLCRPGEPRRLMRRALADLWPPALRARRSKSLFGAPWMEALRPVAIDLLRTPRWQVVERGWIDRAALTTRLERLVHGLECNEPQLRLVVLLECWLRNRDQRHAEALVRTA